MKHYEGMKHYEVCSPTFDDGGSWDPPEPPEPRACFAFVEAETPAKAKAAALRLDEFAPWRDGGGNPFTGLTVRLSRCRHGICYCDNCRLDLECIACEQEFEAGQRAMEAEERAAIAAAKEQAHG